MTGLWMFSYIVLWILFLVMAVILIGVLRNLGVIYESLANSRPSSTHQVPTKLVAGEPLPIAFALHGLGDAPVSLSDFRGAKTAFSIVSPSCGPCHTLLQAIARDEIKPDPQDVTVLKRVIVSVGDIADTMRLIKQADLRQEVPVLIDREGKVAEEWGITSTPTTVIVDAHLKVVRHITGLSLPAQQAAPNLTG
jgi:thiol-disulfide isomerase/thioredoxin